MLPLLSSSFLGLWVMGYDMADCGNVFLVGGSGILIDKVCSFISKIVIGMMNPLTFLNYHLV